MSELVTKSDLEGEITEMKAKLFRFMPVQSVGVIGLTVALDKFPP